MDVVAVSRLLLFLVLVSRVAGFDGQIRVREGDSFVLSCLLARDEATHWEKDGWRLPSASSDYVVRDTIVDGVSKVSTLRVSSADLKQGGDYRCSNRTRNYQQVRVIPRTTASSRVPCYTLVLNESLEIPCSAAGPSSKHRWYRNAEPVVSAADPRVHVLADRLVIERSEERDAGIYRCQSGNRSAAVLVVGPITIDDAPDFQMVSSGSTVDIACNVNSLHAPSVSWSVGEQPLSTLTSKLSLSLGKANVPNSVLTIHNVSDSDRNLYTCRAAHDQCQESAVERSTMLYVQTTGIVTNEVAPGAGLLIQYDDPTLTITCNQTENFTGYVWQKGDVVLVPTDRVTITDDSTTIVVSRPTGDDADKYTCTARGSNDSAVIEVHYKVGCDIDDALSTPTSYWTESYEAKLVAVATGVPRPIVVWFKDNKAIVEGDRVHLEAYQNLSNAVVRVKPVVKSDRGIYSCRASNGGDEDRFDVMVRVRDKYAALYPFAGICLEVSVLLAIIFISELMKREENVGNGGDVADEHTAPGKRGHAPDR